MGQKYYLVPYKISKMIFYLVFALAIYFVSTNFISLYVENEILLITINVLLILIYIVVAYFIDIKNKLKPAI
jgi:hypothetical protein